MGEQTSLTPDEARDLVTKLNGLAAELSPAQLGFLRSTLAAGADSSDVEGHMFGTGGTNVRTILCDTWACTITVFP
jgi:hypothetical protein